MKPPARARSAPRGATAGPSGTIRLIGGRWRGTRLLVPDAPGLRPTADRVRETLFNWLMPKLPGARVLDLCAGSGALGLEALSRGAASAVLVERDRALAAALAEVTARLPGGEAATVVEAEAIGWLAAQSHAHADAVTVTGAGNTSFDLAFLDPPFTDGLWDAAIAGLLPTLANDAWLYVETPPDLQPVLPGDWLLHRDGRTREVRYSVYRRRAGAAATLPDGTSDT